MSCLVFMSNIHTFIKYLMTHYNVVVQYGTCQQSEIMSSLKTHFILVIFYIVMHYLVIHLHPHMGTSGLRDVDINNITLSAYNYIVL